MQYAITRASPTPAPSRYLDPKPGTRTRGCTRLQGVAPPTESTVRIIALALAGMFSGVLSIFAVQHTLIILKNKTQVEDIVSVANQRGRWIFDIGRAANWRQVMGPHWWQWVLPVTFRYAYGLEVDVGLTGLGPDTWLRGWTTGALGVQRNGRHQLPQQRRACAGGGLGRVEPAATPYRRRRRRRGRGRRRKDCVNKQIDVKPEGKRTSGRRQRWRASGTLITLGLHAREHSAFSS